MLKQILTMAAMAAMAAMVVGITGAAEVKLETNGNEWKAVAATYSATSKYGYINSITVDGKEFLAQEKVPSGSYLCAGEIPALKEIKQEQGNIISGSNALGKLVYTFTDSQISCSCENTSQANVVYYFVINPGVKTVRVDDADGQEVPLNASGSSFKWIQEQAVLDFQGGVKIWGPWNGCEVWELRVPAGQTKTVNIIPGKLTGQAKIQATGAGTDQAKIKATGTGTNQCSVFDYSAVGKSGQIPLCMIGDSITWAEKGDCWRKELIERLPNLAFVGTHSAMFGYSHAGEGGNSTGQVLGRVKYIPDCPYYHVLIGTNNNGVKTADAIDAKSRQTAEDVIRIVQELLKKKGAEKVFLSSILPCATDNPLRDLCNSATNKILRERFDTAFPKDKVVWVEYETPVRNTPGWEKKIFLHPNEEGYALVANITAAAIGSALNVKPGTESIRPEKTGVRVANLMGEDNVTVCPVIAGWYIVSCKVDAITAANPEIILESQSPGKNTLRQVIPIKASQGATMSENVFTKYEGYGYTRDFLTLKASGCSISNVLLEKMRPSQKPSIYGMGSYLDTISPAAKGELLEYSK